MWTWIKNNLLYMIIFTNLIIIIIQVWFWTDVKLLFWHTSYNMVIRPVYPTWCWIQMFHWKQYMYTVNSRLANCGHPVITDTHYYGQKPVLHPAKAIEVWLKMTHARTPNYVPGVPALMRVDCTVSSHPFFLRLLHYVCVWKCIIFINLFQEFIWI